MTLECQEFLSSKLDVEHAFKLRKQQQDAERERVGDAWVDTGLVFTTLHGTPIEPRKFNRVLDRRIATVGVSNITVHGTRKPVKHSWRP